jgi:hypothetical protein
MSYGWRGCPDTAAVTETIGLLDALVDDVVVEGARISAGGPGQQR